MATLVKLVASNFKRLTTVSIDFDGAGVVQLSGDNAQGKSSIGDAIFAALGGANAAPETPIRRGEKRADIELHLQDPDIVVRRVFTAEGATSLSIEGVDGKISSPQALLDKLRGKHAFDPLAFSRMKPKERVDLLLSIVDLHADPARLDALAPNSTIEDPLERLAVRYKAVYDERTVVGRIVDQIKGELAPLPEESPDDPAAGVNVSDLVRQRDDLIAKRTTQETQRRNMEQSRAQATALRAQIAKLQSDLVEIERVITDSHAAILQFPDHAPAITAFEEQIEAAEGINERYAQVLRRREISARLQKQEALAAIHTKHLEAVLAYKEELVANAVMPVDEMSFTDGDVTFKGLPFSQASQAEQIRISSAIGMALNPKLRLMWIDDGSLLGPTALALLAEIAEARGFLILVETVDVTGTVGIVIQDGAVVADNRTPRATSAASGDDSCPF